MRSLVSVANSDTGFAASNAMIGLVLALGVDTGALAPTFSRAPPSGRGFLPGPNRGHHAASTIHRRRDARPTFWTWRLGRPSIRPGTLALGRAVVKETKYFRKQAA